MFDFQSVYDKGLSYDDFLKEYADPNQLASWNSMLEQVQLTDHQKKLLGSFTRELRMLCMAGAWCGDCIKQCPIFRRFEEACPLLKIRYVDRDANEALAAELKICGGSRVPQVVFMNEDGKPVGRYGDRTLAKYRQMMASVPGAVLPEPVEDALAAVTQDWLNEIERVQYILRLSPSMRQKHGD